MNRASPTAQAKLTARDPDTLRRWITNAKSEHMAHAFRAGYGAMQDYNRIVPVLRGMLPEELAPWLDLMDEVYESHRQCQPCGCKVLAYQILISKDLLPDRHAGYLDCYLAHIRRWPPAGGRDFMAEVMDSLHHGKDHPHAEAHMAWWKCLFEGSLRDDS